MLPKWALNSRVLELQVYYVLTLIFVFKVSDVKKCLLGLMVCVCSPSYLRLMRGDFVRLA